MIPPRPDSAKGQTVGHSMGERILAIKAKKPSDLTEADLADTSTVVGYAHRRVKQRPNGDVTDTNWRKSLMKWGHDTVSGQSTRHGERSATIQRLARPTGSPRFARDDGNRAVHAETV
jgi:hypothetical protein